VPYLLAWRRRLAASGRRTVEGKKNQQPLPAAGFLQAAKAARKHKEQTRQDSRTVLDDDVYRPTTLDLGDYGENDDAVELIPANTPRDIPIPRRDADDTHFVQGPTNEDKLTSGDHDVVGISADRFARIDKVLTQLESRATVDADINVPLGQDILEPVKDQTTPLPLQCAPVPSDPGRFKLATQHARLVPFTVNHFLTVFRSRLG
jgi:hypothetical protein